MKSFANYRWVLAATVVGAVLVVFFGRPRTVWAGATAALPQGSTAGQCSGSERASASQDDGEDCAACADVATPCTCAPEMVDYAYHDDDSFHTGRGGGRFDGTGASRAGTSSRTGTKDGMLDPHSGDIAMTVPIGIGCLGREGANVVAMSEQSNPGEWTTPISEDTPPPDD